MGGSSGSGTSLLSVILDTHPEIACGPELSVFNKRRLYGGFTQVRPVLRRWLERGLSTDGFTEYRPFFFKRLAYGLPDDVLTQLADRATSLRDFCDRFFTAYLAARGKRVWAEKTPSNVYCIRQFLELYPGGVFVHVVRDGRDVMCSLMGRYASSYRSASTWLYNVAAGLACRDLPGYYEVRYEDLVTDPRRTARALCQRIGVPYCDRMLHTDRNGYRGTPGLEKWHACWKNSPISGDISTRSLGRWRSDMSTSMHRVFWNLELTDRAVRQLGSPWSTAVQIMRELGYLAPGQARSAPRPGLPDYWDALRWNVSRAVREARIERRWWQPVTRVA
jgi:hypothetical protein